jgi:DNA-binding transcriptional LysR family regulator
MLNKTNLHRVDLNLLVLFHVVSDELHVGRAAQRLSISSSAVSHGLTRLRRLLNDPLFLKTPKGVVPTSRAIELGEPIREILARVEHVVDSAAPFNPATSTRRFTIGAPDGVSAVFLPPLLERLGRVAPGVNIGLRQLLPTTGEIAPDRAWRTAFEELESRAVDLAIMPTDHVPTRFHRQVVLIEDFVLAMRAGHEYARRPTLSRYCEAEHLVVSLSGDPYGFIDRALELEGLRRRVALTVPNFMFALAVIADSNMIAALPRTFAAMHAHRFHVITKELPITIDKSNLNAVVPKAAMLDAGVAWLFELLLRTAPKKRRAS